MKKILSVIGTRPQVIKHIPFQKAMSGYYKLVNIHTGQHYDHEMKGVFVDSLVLDHELTLLSTDRESRMLEMVDSISKHINTIKPDMIVVYGDTDTTLAAAQAASNNKVTLCHIEAGLRSHNLQMPEEINRIETDRLSQLLLCPSQEAVDNLSIEKLTKGVYLVGDIMKDAIQMSANFDSDIKEFKYYYATLHRPYNVDEGIRLRYLFSTLNKLNEKVIMPLHPRTEYKMKEFDIQQNEFSNINFIKPQSYLSNLKYMIGSEAVLTDSGGMQKEAYWINKKCVTLRSETEWIETMHDGCNTLVYEDLSKLQVVLKEQAGPWNDSLYGDGKAMIKIKEVIDKYFNRA